MLPSNRPQKRVVVIGWDGATLDLALPWIQAGHLPVLKVLMERGGGGRLRSVLPVLSPSAWASFATGVNPGRHGIFDFVERAPDSYKLRLITARDLKVPTLWRLLSDAGKRVAVINVPITYPPEPVNGVMITGLGTPDRQVFTYPPELTEQLRSQGYRVNKATFYRPGGEDAFLKEVYEVTQQVADTALSVLQQEPWDFFMVVFRDTDEMAHFFWKHMDDSHPAHNPQTDAQYANALLNYYKYLDQLTGQIINAAGPDVDVLIMSDHGLGPLYKDVFLNEWLRQKQLLAIVPGRANSQSVLARFGLTRSNISRSLQRVGLTYFERSLRSALGEKKNLLPANNRAVFPDAIDWPHTFWYSYGYHGQLFLNVQQREPKGIVARAGQYDQLRSQMEQMLFGLIDPEDGKPVVSEIIRQEEAFSGPYADRGADLVIMMRDLAYITRHGYEFTEKSGEVFSQPTTFESGSHRLDGLYFFSGPSFRSCGVVPSRSILDLAPTILHLLSVRHPNHIEGRILLDELVDSDRGAIKNGYDYANTSENTASNSVTLTADEEQELTTRLKNLGYLE
jgi:predicted AlkP superfamily phosphohydrolase/phosphomutase